MTPVVVGVFVLAPPDPQNYDVRVNIWLTASLWVGLALVAAMMSIRVWGDHMEDGNKRGFETTLSISPAHVNGLAARMRTLEEDCREIERHLDGFKGILYEYVGEIPERSRRRMRRTLAEILDAISSMRLELHLPEQVIDLDKMIESRLSHMWVTLHESKSASLRGYGVVPQDLSRYLDPRIDGMLALLARLREALRESTMEAKGRTLRRSRSE